jgi:DNA (cytosine-5)-methyltransferase 1
MTSPKTLANTNSNSKPIIAKHDEAQRMPDVGDTNNNGQAATEIRTSAASGGDSCKTRQEQASEPAGSSQQYAQVADPASLGQQGQGKRIDTSDSKTVGERETGNAVYDGIGREWPPEPPILRVVNGLAARSHRLTAIGNGQVPRVAATAFSILKARLEQ